MKNSNYIKNIMKIYFSNVVSVVGSTKNTVSLEAFHEIVKQTKTDDDTTFVKLYQLYTGDKIITRGYVNKVRCLKQMLDLYEVRGNDLDVLKFRRHSKIGCQTIEKLLRGEL